MVEVLAQKKHTLTADEETLYDEHVRWLEKKIISQYRVILATVGAMCDNRVKSIEEVFSTIIIDEAGQLRQVNAMNLVSLPHHRTIFVGDDRQLKAQWESVSADKAQLGTSMLSWFRLG